MPEDQNFQELIESLKKIEGSCRGVSLIDPLKYLRATKGEKVLLAVEEELRKLGLPTLREIRPLNYYPVGWMTILHLVIKKTLNWGDEEIKEMGNALPKFSFMVKLLMKTFLSPQETFKITPLYWKKHFTIGTLEPIELNNEKKYAVLRLKNYKTHPIDCRLFEGYFNRIAQYVFKSEEVRTEETKCIHKKDPYHEFITTWK